MNCINHLHIHPEDAAVRGLIHEGEALVWSEAGCIRIPVKVTKRMTPGSVSISFGRVKQWPQSLTVASSTSGSYVRGLFQSEEGQLKNLNLMAHISGMPVEAAPVPEGTPAVILAGGQSRRFGSDKVHAEWRGRTLLDYVLTAATAMGRKVILSVSEAATPDFGSPPRLLDQDPMIRTPLNGLIAACRVLNGWFLVLAADAPGICHEVLDLLCEERVREVNRPIVIADGETLHPFPGLYHCSMIDVFENAFDKGAYRVTELVRTMVPVLVPVERIRSVDPELACLKNVNTTEELAALG